MATHKIVVGKPWASAQLLTV